MAKDRFAEMNGVLEGCVKSVAKKVSEYTATQKRIAADKTPAGFATLLPSQIEAMAKQAVAEQYGAIAAAAVASVVAEFVETKK